MYSPIIFIPCSFHRVYIDITNRATGIYHKEKCNNRFVWVLTGMYAWDDNLRIVPMGLQAVEKPSSDW